MYMNTMNPIILYNKNNFFLMNTDKSLNCSFYIIKYLVFKIIKQPFLSSLPY